MRLFDGVPAWPPLAAVAGLVAAYAGSLAVLVIVAIVAKAAGYEPGHVPAGGVLLFAILFALTSVAVCAGIARQTAPPEPAQFGLRRVPPGESALLVVAAAVVLAAVVAAWAWGSVERLALPVPEELDGGDVRLDAALVASALARAVVAPLAGQVVLLGFVLPALARWRGVVPAGLVCVAGLAALAGVVGDGGRLVVPAVTLAVLLLALRLRTGSLLPGAMLGCAAAGAALGAAVRWDPAGVAALAAACGAAGLAVALALATAGRR